jgi:hypothetical protein
VGIQHGWSNLKVPRRYKTRLAFAGLKAVIRFIRLRS